MKVGYLTNVYPAISHSFIKREILALEAAGVTVHRWSVRPFANSFPDPSDQTEADRTDVVLVHKAAIIVSVVVIIVSRPLNAWLALRATLAGRPSGLRAAVVRLAHFAEACYLARAARALGVTHIHAHFGTNPAAVARLTYLLGGPPFSFTVHGPDEFDQPLSFGLGAKIADARFAVAISNFGRSQLMRWSTPDQWPHLHVVRCGLDRAFLDVEISPASEDVPAVFCCVARLAPQKGLTVLVEAAAKLRDAGRSFQIVVLGDGDLRGDLERRIAELDLHPFFDMRGWASGEAVREAIASARAFVLPSFAEGLPVAIMEALALGRPVITTRIAGIPELVDDQCGWLVDAGDPGQLAGALAAALDANTLKLRTLGQVGRARVLKAHDIADSADALARLFRACADETSP